MLVRPLALALTAGALLAGCAADSEDDIQEPLDNLIQAGFPADSSEVIGGRVYTGGDGIVSLQASREMLQSNPKAGGKEQYRTNNVVSPSVHVICFDGLAF